ncbi:transport ATP-binding protein CydD [Lachnospiraceae bacterium KM106-2]|nr:transport ATP-binding protein CydD [Lachnospiraceae bacterium KM106-2]
MFKKVMKYAGEYRKITYLAAVFMIAGVLVSILPYLFLYQLIVPIVAGESMSNSFICLRLGAILICEILYAFVYVHGLALSHKSAYHTLKNIRIALQRKMEKQPLGTIIGYGNGTIKKMFIDDIESIELLLAHAFPEGLANIAVPVIIYIAMFFVDWKLALLSLGSLPIGLFAMGAMMKSGKKKMGAYYKAAQDMNNTIVEYINGMEVVKVFNRDGDSYQNFSKSVKEYRDFTLAWYKASWPFMALYNSILPCTAMITIPFGAYFVLSGYSTLPNLILVLCMGFGVGTPLLRSLSFGSVMPQVKYKIESLENMISAPALKQSDKEFRGKNHTITFDQVHFSYQDKEVLHGVSLEAKEGYMTALVGESGSGKSTLAKLLVHFYDLTSGSIKLGGQDISDMSIEALNQEISYVSQEQFLFNMSLMENIRLGKPEATDQEVLVAAKKAQCDEFLNRLKDGIYTMAGDGGKQLSGGERQRISLARALLKDAPIVVLDEATAFMDPENEEKMNEAIAEIIHQKTVIVIAHRLPSIMNADQIIVLNDGYLKAKGTHEELLQTSSDYQRLWRSAKESSMWSVAIGDEEILREEQGGLA